MREYWVVDPGNRAVQVWRLGKAAKFEMAALRELARDASPVASEALEGFIVDPSQLFEDVE